MSLLYSKYFVIFVQVLRRAMNCSHHNTGPVNSVFVNLLFPDGDITPACACDLLKNSNIDAFFTSETNYSQIYPEV